MANPSIAPVQTTYAGSPRHCRTGRSGRHYIYETRPLQSFHFAVVRATARCFAGPLLQQSGRVSPSSPRTVYNNTTPYTMACRTVAAAATIVALLLIEQNTAAFITEPQGKCNCSSVRPSSRGNPEKNKNILFRL